MVLVGFLTVTASHAICRESVRRPVVRFIDFYQTAKHADQPLTFFDRVFYGVAIATHDEAVSPPVNDTGM